MSEHEYDEAKSEALAAYLDLTDDELVYGPNEHGTYEMGPGEYLVLTDEEADDAAHAEIVRSLWAFNAEWLAGYTPLPVEAIRAIQEAMYEDASDAFESLIGDDMDAFVYDSIGADGRGHFLAGYDGEEIELAGDYYAYRVN
jgi:hypothetical protein